MAYMMSDMAAGSTAALQMQKNMAAAPYVQQETAAAAEETQLKLQQDRLKAQYAPQEMAIKMQQDQANLKAKELNNIVTDSGIELNKETKSIIAKYEADPEHKNQSATDKAQGLAAALMGTDPTSAEKMMKVSSDAAYKQALTDAKTADANLRTIGGAYASIAEAKPEQVQALLERMSPEQHKAIESQIPGFFDERNPALQKSQLEHLMLNSSGQAVQAKIQSNERIHAAQIASHEKIAVARIQQQLNARSNGLETKEEATTLRLYDSSKAEIDRTYQRRLDRAQNNMDELQASVDLSAAKSWFGTPDKTLVAKLNAATTAVKKLDEDRNAQVMRAARLLPNGPMKKSILEELTSTATPDAADEPKVDPGKGAAPAAKAEAAPAAKPDVTSTKVEYTPQERSDATAWLKANPNHPKAAEIKARLEGETAPVATPFVAKEVAKPTEPARNLYAEQQAAAKKSREEDMAKRKQKEAEQEAVDKVERDKQSAAYRKLSALTSGKGTTKSDTTKEAFDKMEVGDWYVSGGVLKQKKKGE